MPQARSRLIAKPDVESSEVGFVIGGLGLGLYKIFRRCILVAADLSYPRAPSPKSAPRNRPNTAMENGQPANGSQSPGLSLSRILDDESIEHLEQHKHLDAPAEGWDEEATGTRLEDGYCVECEGMPASPGGFDVPGFTYRLNDADQPAQVYCESCTDNFCDVCFAAQHRKGSRKQHMTKPLTVTTASKPQPATSSSSSNGAPANGHDDEVGLFPHAFRFPDRFTFADGHRGCRFGRRVGTG